MRARNSRGAPVLCDERDANRYVSRVIPWVIMGTFGYACYAVTKPLCSKDTRWLVAQTHLAILTNGF